MNIEKSVLCKHNLEPAKEIIVLKGRTVIVEAERCSKCGEVLASPKEVERARKELNPSLLKRLKELIGLDKVDGESASIFKGKVL